VDQHQQLFQHQLAMQIGLHGVYELQRTKSPAMEAGLFA
jgi:hypothetical protein